MSANQQEQQEEQESADPRGWVARRVFPDGKEPDPRFTLANERTFLAWTRTSLAFLAGGIAFEIFPISGLSEVMRSTIGVLVIFVGLLISLGASVRWLKVERAMRHDRPLPVPAILPLLSLAAFCACLFALVVFAVG